MFECVSKILKRQTELNVICVLNGTTANVQAYIKKLPKIKYWFCRTCYIVKD